MGPEGIGVTRYKKDVIVWCAAAFLAAYLAFYTLPILPDEQLIDFSMYLATPVLIGLAFLSFLEGARVIRHREERRFWSLLAAGFGCWFLGAVLRSTTADLAGAHWVEPAVDSLFLLSYLACILAIDHKPHLESGWSVRNLSYAFSTLGSLLFVCGLILYFFLIPYVFRRAHTDVETPTTYLVIALDGLLAVRFAYLAVVCKLRTWRGVYGVLALASMFWITTDSLELAIRNGIAQLDYGTGWDFLWYAPFFLVIGVGRWRNVPEEKPASKPVLGSDPTPGDWQTEPPALLLLYAFLFPVFHIALNALGMLESEGRILREGLVLLSLLSFVALAVSQQWLLAKRNRELNSAITVLVSNEQMQQAQKMEAIGRLAGGVAHDFNNLLAVIHGRASLVLETMGPDDPARSGIEEIDKASTRGSWLTRQLLAFARSQVFQPRVLSLNDVLEDSGAMLRRLLGRNVLVETRLAPDLGSVQGDSGQILQVVMNLVVNARDAMPEGGTLTLETANVVLGGDEPDLLPPGESGRYVALSVTDTGCGMNEETRSLVFEPFFTGKSEGTGLGLATVYGIVRQSGGCLQVGSEEGSGTTFTVYLPAVDGLPESVEPEGEPASRGTAVQPSTVLLVEDEDPVRETVRDLLEHSGMEVLEASDGEKAMEIFEDASERIDALVTDIMMPGMNGWQLGERIRAARPGLPALYMSGFTDGTADGDRSLGVNEVFLEKPFDLPGFLAKLRALLGEASSKAS